MDSRAQGEAIDQWLNDYQATAVMLDWKPALLQRQSIRRGVRHIDIFFKSFKQLRQLPHVRVKPCTNATVYTMTNDTQPRDELVFTSKQEGCHKEDEEEEEEEEEEATCSVSEGHH
ncbi:unnamed protein product [Mesocestoides corti]|uniref:Uncharacterized protein n=1 Tax=Mesocestoides corti TaxID=53468 RepID=A0A0R3UCV4_MESCO|nr:unnamed protein product [Mesocestoides corti]